MGNGRHRLPCSCEFLCGASPPSAGSTRSPRESPRTKLHQLRVDHRFERFFLRTEAGDKLAGTGSLGPTLYRSEVDLLLGEMDGVDLGLCDGLSTRFQPGNVSQRASFGLPDDDFLGLLAGCFGLLVDPSSCLCVRVLSMSATEFQMPAWRPVRVVFGLRRGFTPEPGT